MFVELKHSFVFIVILLFFQASAFSAVTPQMFGAIGDGVHDDTKAIQTALDCRGKVFLAAGVYRISSKLVVHSGTVFYGEKGSCIKQTEDTFILYNENSQRSDANWDENITIRSIAFDGATVEAVSEYTAGMYMCGVRGLTVENCTMTDIGGDGIYMGRAGKDRYCEKVRIINCSFNNCGRNVSNPRQSIAIVFAEDVRITNCSMSNMRKNSYAVDVEPNKTDEHCSVYIANCRMVGCGISSGGDQGATKTVSVSKCFIDCSMTDNAPIAISNTKASLSRNVIVSNGQNNGIAIVSSCEATIRNNSISSAAAGILVASDSKSVIVTGNEINGCFCGIYVMNSSGANIKSNTLERIRNKGVYLRLGSGNATVYKNHIETEEGFDIYSVESNDIEIVNNKCRSAYFGIYCNGENVLVRKNKSYSEIKAEGRNCRIINNPQLK